ncbi:xanthine dehydrogenase family protein subunit M [Sphingopyxis sp. CCNWLW253]|uniref:FAD binding domain-containing protein n=1 Tax=unclassified Sphingopyxis TaxID=2614943 RepID=UPI003012A56D
MKPAAFDYVRAESPAHAVEILAAVGSDAKLIAGGQSLMPMINFRLVQPAILVDINGIAGLEQIEDQEHRVTFGALVRHRMTAASVLVRERIPVLHDAMRHVAHLTVRNRGTFCGSICHADPAAEMPMLALLLEGRVQMISSRGTRELAMDDFLQSSLTTALEPDEMVTGITIDKPAATSGWAFAEFARRHGDYALAAVAVLLTRGEYGARGVRIAMMGVGDRARRMIAVERIVEGSQIDPVTVAAAVEQLRVDIEPPSDLGGSSEYRRYLAGELLAGALPLAWSRATDGRIS